MTENFKGKKSNLTFINSYRLKTENKNYAKGILPYQLFASCIAIVSINDKKMYLFWNFASNKS